MPGSVLLCPARSLHYGQLQPAQNHATKQGRIGGSVFDIVAVAVWPGVPVFAQSGGSCWPRVLVLAQSGGSCWPGVPVLAQSGPLAGPPPAYSAVRHSRQQRRVNWTAERRAALQQTKWALPNTWVSDIRAWFFFYPFFSSTCKRFFG